MKNQGTKDITQCLWGMLKIKKIMAQGMKTAMLNM
jgi:hypothetical protein